MDLHGLIEGFDNIVFSFTRSVFETFRTEDIYRRQEFHDCLPLENTGLERCPEPVDQMIYQEYSDKHSTVDDFLPQCCKLRAVIQLHVSSAETSTVEQAESHKSNHERELYWKELRPSILRTICKSMVFGAWISLLSAFTGWDVTHLNLLPYLPNCSLLSISLQKLNSLEVQWLRVISTVISHFFF